MSSTLDESQRLRVLLDLNILDTAKEERFDRITRMAARLFDVPMAFVSLVDADRLWFKSQVGYPFSEAPSDASFCTHAIRQDGMMVVCDALEDPRFAGSRYVTGFPQVRFYAGLPIAANGAYVGTFCLVGNAPREFSEEDRALLRDFAAMVANEVAAGALDACQSRVHRSDASLRALLEHLPDSVLLIDDGGAVVSANPAAERLFRRDAASLCGQPAATLLGIDAAQLATRGAEPLRIEVTLCAECGSLPVEAALSALEIDGRPHVVASVRDASAHRAALEAERAAEQRRRVYFRTATHELRTPMASILGFSELLLKRDYDAATARELLDIVHKQATRLVLLINQMLDMARIEAGGPDEEQRAAVALPELLSAALATTLTPERAADVVVAGADPALPRVRANAVRLQQALSNLLSNALRFSRPGTPVVVALTPAMREGRPGALLEVRDAGIGMTPEQSAHMFDAFYRANERPDMEGNGLGLTLVRDILALHDARVEVASRSGAGTTVSVWMPAAWDTA